MITLTRFDMIRTTLEFDFVLALMFIGSWLEDIGGKYGLFDKLLTPLPLGIGGLGIVFIERL